jgi:hypothetical protein
MQHLSFLMGRFSFSRSSRLLDGKAEVSCWLPCLVLFTIAYMLYVQSFYAQWTYDDFSVVVKNPDIQSFQAFWENHRTGRPFREITFLADYLIFKLEPAGYHIQAIFWHALNSCLIFFLVHRLTDKVRMAWIASLLFLIHPINVEVVAQISHRKDSLSLAFSLISILFFMKLIESNKYRSPWLLISISAAVIAYFAKQNAVMIPAVMITYLLVYKELTKKFKQLKSIILASLLMGAGVFIVWYFWGEGRSLFLEKCRIALGGMNYLGPCSEAVYARMVLKSWLFLFLRLIIPLKLAPEYQYAVPESWLDLWVISAILLLLVWGVCVYYSYQKHALVCFFLVWIGLFWLPTSSVWPMVTNRLIADRYLYTPSVGFFVLMSFIMCRIIKNSMIRATAVVIWSIILVGLTWHQIGVWESPCHLWDHAVKVSPQSSTALNNLGRCFYKRGDYDKATEMFLKSVKANPHNASPYFNLGLAFEKTQKQKLSIYYFKKFLSIDDPRYYDLVPKLKQKLREQYGINIRRIQ